MCVGGSDRRYCCSNIIIRSLYSHRQNSKNTGLTLDLLSRGNSDQNELREVVAGAVSNQRVENFRFRGSFEEGWWRVILPGQVEVAHPLPQPPGCRADTEIVCPGSAHRICNVQRCDGEEDCPRLAGQTKSWDETEGKIFSSSSTLFEILLFPSTLELRENIKSRLCFSDDNSNYCGTNNYHDNHDNYSHYDYYTERSVSEDLLLFVFKIKSVRLSGRKYPTATRDH